jgi:hypothetical protein
MPSSGPPTFPLAARIIPWLYTSGSIKTGIQQAAQLNSISRFSKTKLNY